MVLVIVVVTVKCLHSCVVVVVVVVMVIVVVFVLLAVAVVIIFVVVWWPLKKEMCFNGKNGLCAHHWASVTFKNRKNFKPLLLKRSCCTTDIVKGQQTTSF